MAREAGPSDGFRKDLGTRHCSVLTRGPSGGRKSQGANARLLRHRSTCGCGSIGQARGEAGESAKKGFESAVGVSRIAHRRCPADGVWRLSAPACGSATWRHLPRARVVSLAKSAAHLREHRRSSRQPIAFSRLRRLRSDASRPCWSYRLRQPHLCG